MTSAGIIVIANEVLSGKVDEENARFSIRLLRSLGIRLERISVIRDDIDEIADEVDRMSRRFDLVITSGGVGPTHDDMTMAGIAKGLGTTVERHPMLVEIIERHYPKARITERLLRMADVPGGSRLVPAPDLRFPVVCAKNVYILPGVPEFFRLKLEALRQVFSSDSPFVLKEVFVRVGEERIADLLEATQNAHPGLEIGSYPRFDDADHKVRVTLESRDPATAESGLAALLRGLAPEDIVRVVS